LPGLFGIYETGRRSLLAYQSAMSTVGHNVANAATPGFRRQRVDLQATMPVRDLFGSIGTGVTLNNVQRVEDRFLEMAVRREIPVLAGFTARAGLLAQAESAFGEPSDGGITTLLDDFYGAWDDLASNPEDAAVRGTVVRTGVTLVDAVRASRARLEQQAASVDGEIGRTLDDANRVLTDLAHVNQAILTAEREGRVPPDLEDRRDLLLDAAAELVGATSQVNEDGTATVWVAERVVLQRGETLELSFRAENGSVDRKLRIEGRELLPEEVDGRIGGLVRARDEDIRGAMRRLDEFAVRIARDVNAIHRTGTDQHGRPAGDFFVMDDIVGNDGVDRAAEAIRVARPLLDDSMKVAAGRTGEPGDGSLALDLAALRNDPAGATGMLQTLVVDLGSRSREAMDVLEGQQLVVDSYLAQRESVSGVSLDEEAANLMRFQRSYEAAARVLSTADDMVRTILEL
jgi:flagellar hook-associated protein 1 FlgK